MRNRISLLTILAIVLAWGGTKTSGSETFTLTATPSTVDPGGEITVSWTAPEGQTSRRDWIGFFREGASNSNYLHYRYTDGATSGSFIFTTPQQPVGVTYEFRYLLNAGLTDVATSNPVTVTFPDECTNAIPVEACKAPNGSTIRATGTETSSCGYNDTLDVWYSFTPEATYDYTISLCGSSFDTTLAIFDSCGGTELACNNDSGPGICPDPDQSQLTVPLVAGSTYFIRIAGYDGQTGDYALIVTATVTLTATPSYVDPGEDITVSWTAPCASSRRDWIGLFREGASNSDYLAYRYTEGAASGSFIGQAPDTPGIYEFRYLLNAGTTDVATSNPVTVGVPNECSYAIPVELDKPYNGSTIIATGSETSSCGYNDTLDVWYSFTPEATYDHTISLCGSTFDTTLAIFDSCGGTELACNDDTEPGVCPDPNQSQLTVPLVAGSTYFIRIAGNDGQTGDYTLIVTGPRCTEPIASDLNGDCKVNLLDLAIFCSEWLKCNVDPPDACWE